MDFRSSVEDINEVTKRVKVTIPAELVKQEFEKAIGEFSKTVKLKGFRVGQAPRQMIEKLHGSRIQLEVANKLISQSLDSVVKENKIEVVGTPEIDLSSFDPGKDVEYTANISIFPTPTITGYEKVKVSVRKRDVGQKEVDELLEKFRQQKATLRKNEFRTVCQLGDVVDTSISIESGPEGASPRPEPLVVGLGEGNIPADLEQGIVGMTVGESKTITLKTPEDHPNEQLRGQETVYKITLNTISEKLLPELDDAFAKSLEWGVETLLELRIKAREKLEEETKRETRADIQSAVLEELVKKNEFAVPQVIIDDEIRSMLVRAGAIDPKKMDVRDIPVDQFREKLGETALKRVRTAIIVDRVGQIEKVEATKDDLAKSITEIASRNNLPEEEVKKYFMERSRVISFMLETSRNKVLDLLHDRAVVEYTEEAKA